jgi:hypothetical protein
LVTVIAIAIALGACTYNPSFGDCRVAACESAADCPDGFTCDPQHYCRAPGSTLACDEVLVDAQPSIDAPPGSDASSVHCVGTATACTFSTLQACGNQSGCAWVAPTCTVTTNCSMFTTNTACEAQDECFTDFTNFSMCTKYAPACQGATEAACETHSYCAYAGGCGGTPNACGEFTSQGACTAQMGCSWQ